MSGIAYLFTGTEAQYLRLLAKEDIKNKQYQYRMEMINDLSRLFDRKELVKLPMDYLISLHNDM